MSELNDQNQLNSIDQDKRTNNQGKYTPNESPCQRPQKQNRYYAPELFFWLVFGLILLMLVTIQHRAHNQFLDPFLDAGVKAMVMLMVTMFWKAIYKRLRKRRGRSWQHRKATVMLIVTMFWKAIYKRLRKRRDRAGNTK